MSCEAPRPLPGRPRPAGGRGVRPRPELRPRRGGGTTAASPPPDSAKAVFGSDGGFTSAARASTLSAVASSSRAGAAHLQQDGREACSWRTPPPPSSIWASPWRSASPRSTSSRLALPPREQDEALSPRALRGHRPRDRVLRGGEHGGRARGHDGRAARPESEFVAGLEYRACRPVALSAGGRATPTSRAPSGWAACPRSTGRTTSGGFRVDGPAGLPLPLGKKGRPRRRSRPRRSPRRYSSSPAPSRPISWSIERLSRQRSGHLHEEAQVDLGAQEGLDLLAGPRCRRP